MARRKNIKRIDPRYFLNETVNRNHDGSAVDEGALNIALDLAGLVPGIGEYADAANAALYAKEGKWLLAGLSLISIIPAVGDAIGKGGKIAIWASKNLPKTTKYISKYGPELVKMAQLIKDQAPTIKAIFTAISRDEKVKSFLGGDEGVAEMERALEAFADGDAPEFPTSTSGATLAQD